MKHLPGVGSQVEGHLAVRIASAGEGLVSGLPRCYTFVGDLDPHRDETLDVVIRMADAGVPVGLGLYMGCVHGFDVYVAGTQLSEQAMQTTIEAVNAVLWK